jgi:hypothetical protein
VVASSGRTALPSRPIRMFDWCAASVGRRCSAGTVPFESAVMDAIRWSDQSGCRLRIRSAAMRAARARVSPDPDCPSTAMIARVGLPRAAPLRRTRPTVPCLQPPGPSLSAPRQAGTPNRHTQTDPWRVLLEA